MPGLRFFACDGCETVYALPDETFGCGRCEEGSLTEITASLQDDAYFLPPGRER